MVVSFASLARLIFYGLLSLAVCLLTGLFWISVIGDARIWEKRPRVTWT
jgi:hypothetical protein